MRVDVPAKQGIPQMPRLVAEDICAREFALQPTRKQIDGEWEAIHLGKERHHKGRKRAQAAPIPRRLRFGEAECKDDENRRVENHQRPQPVRATLVHHSSSLLRFALP